MWANVLYCLFKYYLEVVLMEGDEFADWDRDFVNDGLAVIFHNKGNESALQTLQWEWVVMVPQGLRWIADKLGWCTSFQVSRTVRGRIASLNLIRLVRREVSSKENSNLYSFPLLRVVHYTIRFLLFLKLYLFYVLEIVVILTPCSQRIHNLHSHDSYVEHQLPTMISLSRLPCVNFF